MATTYNNTSLTFQNLTKNRTLRESQENAVFLTTFFIEKSSEPLYDYMLHNQLEYNDDIFIKSLKYESMRFFENEENIKELNEIINEFRDDKVNNNLNKHNDFVLESDSEEKIFDSNKFCNCNFCNQFRSADENWEKWVPKNSSEEIIKTVILNFVNNN
jgi:hypothetical protein